MVKRPAGAVFRMALAFGLPTEAAEDAASHVFLKRLQGMGVKQNAYHAVIDHLRTLPPIHAEINDEIMDGNGVPQDAYQDVLRVFDSLNRLDRAVCVLYAVWGMNQQEIAFAFGWDKSRVAQRIGLIRKKLLKGQE